MSSPRTDGLSPIVDHIRGGCLVPSLVVRRVESPSAAGIDGGVTRRGAIEGTLKVRSSLARWPVKAIGTVDIVDGELEA